MKDLKLTVGGAGVTVQLAGKITKEDLYGRVDTLVEREGRRLERGYLTPDGQLLRRSQLSNVGVDPDGTVVETPVVLFDDQPASQAESSFDRETELREAPLTRLVDLNVSDVYQLEAGGLKPGLYEGCFNYRKSYLPKDTLLLVKEAGAFLLVGQFKRTTFVGKDQTYEFFDAPAEEAEGDALDFAMM